MTNVRYEWYGEFMNSCKACRIYHLSGHVEQSILKRRALVIELRDQKNMSFGMIGLKLGISRQTVHEMYHRWKKASDQELK